MARQGQSGRVKSDLLRLCQRVANATVLNSRERGPILPTPANVFAKQADVPKMQPRRAWEKKDRKSWNDAFWAQTYTGLGHTGARPMPLTLRAARNVKARSGPSSTHARLAVLKAACPGAAQGGLSRPLLNFRQKLFQKHGVIFWDLMLLRCEKCQAQVAVPRFGLLFEGFDLEGHSIPTSSRSCSSADAAPVSELRASPCGVSVEWDCAPLRTRVCRV